MTGAVARFPAIAVAAAACPPTAVASPTPGTRSPTVTVCATASPIPTPTAECAVRVLAAMTPEQHIGRLFLLGLANDQLGAAEVSAIRAHHFGSVWFVEQSTAGVAAVRDAVDAVHVLADASTTANIRFFVAANHERRPIQSLSGPGFTVSARPPRSRASRQRIARSTSSSREGDLIISKTVGPANAMAAAIASAPRRTPHSKHELMTRLCAWSV